MLFRAESYIQDSRGGITLADLVHVLPLQSVSDEAQEALSKIEYLEGDSATKVKEYDGVVRSLWEVNQLYEQFRWNYGELRRLVPCDRSDSRFQDAGPTRFGSGAAPAFSTLP